MITTDRAPFKTTLYFKGVYKADKDYPFVVAKTINGSVKYSVVELDGAPADDHRNDDGVEVPTEAALRRHLIASIERLIPDYIEEVQNG